MPAEYYERLGVSEDASTSEIKQAFRDRIKETHPDISDDDAASERTKRLIEARDVLTDRSERERYDRLGHETYVQQSATGPAQNSTDVTEPTASSQSKAEQAGQRKAAGGTASGQESRGVNGQRANRSESTQKEGTDSTRSQQGADWYDSSRTGTGGNHHAWETDRSYAVGDSEELFEPRSLLSSQRTIVLLGTTFVIYPVLLFGSLYPTFPVGANLIVGLCTVLVVSFLQSVPRVGILVFGTWTVLLPGILFGFLGVPLLSLYGVLAMAAVLFPLGLSTLTWTAIKPRAR